MLTKGDVTIYARRKKVGNFLVDPSRVGQCVPGVRKIETGESQRTKLKVHGTTTGRAMRRSDVSNHFALVR